MADAKIRTDGPHIDVSVPQELQHWAEKLDATPQQIRDAIAAVGHRADDVELHLKGSRATSNADQAARAR